MEWTITERKKITEDGNVGDAAKKRERRATIKHKNIGVKAGDRSILKKALVSPWNLTSPVKASIEMAESCGEE